MSATWVLDQFDNNGNVVNMSAGRISGCAAGSVTASLAEAEPPYGINARVRKLSRGPASLAPEVGDSVTGIEEVHEANLSHDLLILPTAFQQI